MSNKLNNNYSMWKELSEVPELIRYNLNHFNEHIDINLKTLNVNDIDHIKLIASGSSNNASLAGRFIFEEILGIPTTIEYASEFAHKNYVLGKKTLVIGMSQSGKTADTLAALKKIKIDIGSHIFGITNIKGSPIYNIADSNLLIGAGEEKAVPATKTFSLQLLALFNLALFIAEKRSVNIHKINFIKEELFHLPELLTEIIDNKDGLISIAEEIAKKKHLVFLSRGINYPIAKEGALKIKETCYIDSNGYPAGEFMHGYMAILDEDFDVIVLEFVQDEFLRANILKLKQKSNVRIIGLTMNYKKASLYDTQVVIPATKTKLTSTFLFTTCLQIMSFYSAVSLGNNPDVPRGLTKYISREK